MKLKESTKEIRVKGNHWEISMKCFNYDEYGIDILDASGYFVRSKNELKEL